MENFYFAKKLFALMGTAFEVYNELGGVFLETIYQESYEKELEIRSIPFRPQPLLKVCYQGIPLRKEYFPHIIAYEKIMVELLTRRRK